MRPSRLPAAATSLPDGTLRWSAAWPALVAVVVGAAVLLFWRLAAYPLTDGDATFYARVARNIAESGDWVVLRFDPSAVATDVDKPPLGLWPVAALFRLFGATDLVARLWHAALSLALLALTAAVASRVYGRRAALYTAVVLLTSVQFFYQAREPLLDVPLALCVTAALWAMLRADLRPSPPLVGLAGACTGFGVMTKGPIAAVLVAIPVAAVVWWRCSSEWRGRRAWSAVAAGVALFALVVVPWHAAAWGRSGSSFAAVYVGAVSWSRYLRPEHVPGAGVPVYAGFLLLGLMPWSGLLAPAVVTAWRTGGGRPAVLCLLACVAGALAFMGLSPGAFVWRYILPVLPAAAVLIGGFLATASRRLLGAAAWSTLGAGALLAIGLASSAAGGLPGAATLRATLPILAVATIAGGVALLARRTGAAIATLATGAAITYVVLLASLLPIVTALLPEREFARLANDAAPGGARLAVFRPASDESMLAFYATRPPIRVDDEAALARFVSEMEPGFVVERTDRPLPPPVRERLRVVSRGLNATLLRTPAPAAGGRER